jgi:serine/threonine protein kinase
MMIGVQGTFYKYTMADTVPQLEPSQPEPAITRTVVQRTPSTHQGRPSDLEPGMQVDDFDLLALLGEGGFARVFLARQRSMQRIVALKVSADRGREPQTLAQFDHPHIVRVHDQRRVADRGLRLLYMQYLAGGTLQQVVARVRSTPMTERSGRLLLECVDEHLRRRGEEPPHDSRTRQLLATLTWPDAVCWLGARLAEALAYAHARGVLHHDLKPANVLLGADCSPRLADFNVSTTKADDEGIGGSFGYMSPEHLAAMSKHGRVMLDGRSDLFSLAVTLWELLTGTRPFAHSEPATETHVPVTAMMAHRAQGVSSATILALPPGMPPGLHDILRSCLAADPADRPATAESLARQLDLCRKPAPRKLLKPDPGWRTFVARYPVIILLLVGLIPNLIAAWFSIEYNRSAIVAQVPAAQDMFKLLQLIINGTFFPLCTLMVAATIWPVARGLEEVRAGTLDPARLPWLRRRTLALGPLSVLFCFWAWVVAGVLFPLVMHLRVQELPASFHLHFLTSQSLCGLIAVCYPQFGVTFLALRTLYPRFIPDAVLAADDMAALRRIDRVQGVFLVIAASIPLLAVGLLAVIGGENRVALLLLSVIGILGFLLAWLLANAIRTDRIALKEIAGGELT